MQETTKQEIERSNIDALFNFNRDTRCHYHTACESYDLFNSLLNQAQIEGEQAVLDELKTNPGALITLLVKGLIEAKQLADIFLPAISLAHEHTVLTVKDTLTEDLDSERSGKAKGHLYCKARLRHPELQKDA